MTRTSPPETDSREKTLRFRGRDASLCPVLPGAPKPRGTGGGRHWPPQTSARLHIAQEEARPGFSGKGPAPRRRQCTHTRTRTRGQTHTGTHGHTLVWSGAPITSEAPELGREGKGKPTCQGGSPALGPVWRDLGPAVDAALALEPWKHRTVSHRGFVRRAGTIPHPGSFPEAAPREHAPSQHSTWPPTGCTGTSSQASQACPPWLPLAPGGQEVP